MNIHRQLPLPLSASWAPSMDNYCRGTNGLALDMIGGFRQSTDVHQIYLWGGAQCGKSHLLLAAHNDFLSDQQRSFYVSLKEPSLSVDLFDSLEGYALLALDDIDHVAGNDQWEQALFNIINFTRERFGKIIFAASSAPASHSWTLPDLVSRLTWGPIFKLQALSEAHIREAFLLQADKKGLQISEETIEYLLSRHSRDVNSLFELVAFLDRESLAAGRARITIPFLKSCLPQDQP